MARVAHALSCESAACDLELALLFACLHDTQRHTDDHDIWHGDRARFTARQMHKEGILQLDDRRLLKLYVALVYHDRGETHDDPDIGVCWDADRLTLSRIGITPQPEFMSLPQSKTAAAAQLGRRIVEGPDVDWPEICGAYSSADGVAMIEPAA